MEIGLRLRGGAQSPVSLAHVVLDAERAGMQFVRVADDVRLPTSGLDHASSAWPSVGAIAVATRNIPVQLDGIPIAGCLHPAGIAHLAVAAAAMLPGRFGIGFYAGPTRAVTGQAVPSRPVRLQAIEEAVEVVRRLAAGERLNLLDRSVVINDLWLSGGLATGPAVSITATEDTEAVLAADLRCDLVVALGADVAAMISAYRGAGGTGAVSTPLLVSGPDREHSIAVARSLLTARGADGARASVHRSPGESGWMADDDVRSQMVDLEHHDGLFAGIARLGALGVQQVELLSVARDPHLVVRRWREHVGAVESPFAARPGDAAGASRELSNLPPPPVAPSRLRPAVVRAAHTPRVEPANRPVEPTEETVAATAAEVIIDLRDVRGTAGPMPDDAHPDELRLALAQAMEGEDDEVDLEDDSSVDPSPFDPELAVKLADRLNS